MGDSTKFDVNSVVDKAVAVIQLAQKYLPLLISALEFMRHFNVGTVLAAQPHERPQAFATELHAVADKVGGGVEEPNVPATNSGVEGV